jgi:hypothetical protein
MGSGLEDYTGFEPTIPASDRSHPGALESTATEIDMCINTCFYVLFLSLSVLKVAALTEFSIPLNISRKHVFLFFPFEFDFHVTYVIAL